MRLPQKNVKSYCVLANTSKPVQKIINSLNSNEFECLGIFVINEDTPQQLNDLSRVPDVLFLENCDEAEAVKSYFKMRYTKTSIVYLESRESIIRNSPQDLTMGETILMI